MEIFFLLFSAIGPNVDVSQTSTYCWGREPTLWWLLCGRAHAQGIPWALPGVVHHTSPIHRHGNRCLCISFITNNTDNFVSGLYGSQAKSFNTIQRKLYDWKNMMVMIAVFNGAVFSIATGTLSHKIKKITLLVLILKYFLRNKSVPLQPMSWIISSPGHLKPYHDIQFVGENVSLTEENYHHAYTSF